MKIYNHFAKMFGTYKGQISNDLPLGYGVWKGVDSDITYKGNWNRGRYHGYGLSKKIL